jgi:hypothetical protein
MRAAAAHPAAEQQALASLNFGNLACLEPNRRVVIPLVINDIAALQGIPRD